MTAELVAFPERSLSDIPERLRSLATAIEAGEFDDAHLLAYVIDGGDGRIHIGMLGQGAEPGAVAYYLYGLGMRKLEQVT